MVGIMLLPYAVQTGAVRAVTMYAWNSRRPRITEMGTEFARVWHSFIDGRKNWKAWESVGGFG
jgi:hypothetical protein